MLENMCRHALSAADMKAIGKVRGFSAAEVSSRTRFENAFLSELGLKAAFAALNVEEIACLHLLSMEAEPVDISYFSRLYKKGENYWRATFTQVYSPVFKSVQRSLIRRGLLFINEASVNPWEKTTKIERWRFALPDAFVRHLPAPFARIDEFIPPGDVQDGALRRKLLEILGGRVRATADKHDMALCKGRLHIGKRVFSLDALLAWRQHTWNRNVWVANGPQTSGKGTGRGDAAKKQPGEFTELVNYAFSRLDPGQWIRHQELAPLLRLSYHEEAPPRTRGICELGWELGCLARYMNGGEAYYRPVEAPTNPELSPQDYLAVKGDAVLVDMETVPYRDLERIVDAAKLTIAGQALAARPDIIRMGRASDEAWKDPLMQWLREKAAPFREAMEGIEVRRGKRIVHDNLLMARVKDLSLRVAIQKAIPESQRLVSLPNGYLAFPVEALAEIKRAVVKSGFVIKSVEAS